MERHLAFDLLAWALAAGVGRWVVRSGMLGAAPVRTLSTDPWYFTALAGGVTLGAVLFGSLNLSLRGALTLGHSVAGALAGGVVAVELYKFGRKIHGSTGARFALPIAVGVAVGRVGCFEAGLADQTFGTPTGLPWGVDLGDGIARHPVQLYEAAAMALFAIAFLVAARWRPRWVGRHAFYVFVGWYGAQRFAWEFLKPYPRVLGPFNLFHLLCASLVAYAAVMIGRGRADELSTAV